MNYLITGSNGLLGQKLLQKLKSIDCKIIATSLGENKNPEIGFYTYENLDITNQKMVNEIINKYQPNVIINTDGRIAQHDNTSNGANIDNDII